MTMGSPRSVAQAAIQDLLDCCKQGSGVDADRRFTRPRAKHRAVDADHVPDVEQLQPGEGFLAKIVAAEVQLNSTAHVGKVCEDRFSLPAPRHDAPRDAHDGTFRLAA